MKYSMERIKICNNNYFHFLFNNNLAFLPACKTTINYHIKSCGIVGRGGCKIKTRTCQILDISKT